MAFGRKKKKKQQAQAQVQAPYTDAAQIEQNASRLGKMFIGALDRAVHLQSGMIRAYVDWLRRNNPDASPAEIQRIMDRHFLTAVGGTGAGVGGAAAVPGVGFITGTAAIAGESLLFVDIAAVYTVGSAYLRGVDISDAEHRRAIVLMVLLGTQGAAIVDTLVGPEAQKLPTAKSLSRFSGPTLNQANSLMTRTLTKSIGRRMRRMWLGKIMPLGIGVVAGTMANRALAKKVSENVETNLGPAPADFVNALPPKSAEEEKIDKASHSKKTRIGAIIDVIRRNRDEEPVRTIPGAGDDSA